jgi:hypothetical protein
MRKTRTSGSERSVGGNSPGVYLMCARQSWHRPAGVSPACGRTQTASPRLARASQYRVLRVALSRGSPRSVDRECAGRNASSVKVSSPEKHSVPWWPSKYAAAKATSAMDFAGTTGVQVHSMYTRPMSEPGRSVWGVAQNVSPRHSAGEQGLTAKPQVSAQAEVRSRHSSEEVG